MHWSDKMINVSIIPQQLVLSKKCMVGIKYFLIISVKLKVIYANANVIVTLICCTVRFLHPALLNHPQVTNENGKIWNV